MPRINLIAQTDGSAGDIGSNRKHLARTLDGNLHSVYKRRVNSDTTATAFIEYLYYAVSSDNGSTWEETVMTDDSSYSESCSVFEKFISEITISVGSDNNVHILWTEAHWCHAVPFESHYYVKYRRYTDSWQSEQIVKESDLSIRNYISQVADADNIVHIFYKSASSKTLYYVSIDDGIMSAETQVYVLPGLNDYITEVNSVIDINNSVYVSWINKYSDIYIRKVYPVLDTTIVNPVVKAYDSVSNFIMLSDKNGSLHFIWKESIHPAVYRGNYLIRYNMYGSNIIDVIFNMSLPYSISSFGYGVSASIDKNGYIYIMAVNPSNGDIIVFSKIGDLWIPDSRKKIPTDNALLSIESLYCLYPMYEGISSNIVGNGFSLILDKYERKTGSYIHNIYYYKSVSESDPPVNSEESGPQFGCDIDISTGIVKFDRDLLKEDDWRIDITNNTILTESSLNHKEIEDSIEGANLGLPARIADTSQSNFLKVNSYIGENMIIDMPSLSQSELLPFDDRDEWYDKINSTVEYSEQSSKDDKIITSRDYAYPTCVLYNGVDTVYVGFNDALLSINVSDQKISIVDYDGNGGYSAVKDLILDSSIVYMATDHEIFTYNGIWSLETTNGISGNIRKIAFVNNNKLVLTDEGIFIYDLSTEKYVNVKAISNPVCISYQDYAFAIDGSDLYYSVDGSTWEKRGSFTPFYVNAFDRYRGLHMLATSKGLRSDNAGFYEGCDETISTTLIDLETDLIASAAISFNDIKTDTDNNTFIAVASDGRYWIYDGSAYIEKTDSGMDAIHKVLYVENDYWLFGYNFLKISSQSDLIDLGQGEYF